MADLWFYTRDGKTMPPVSGVELKQLAVQGLLKPSDFVWTDSLPRWERASTQNFFADKELLLVPEKTAERPPVDDAPRRSSRRQDERYVDDDDDRPRRRRRPPAPTGMNPGLKVGLIVGGSLIALILLVVVVVAFKAADRANQRARFRVPPNNPPFVFNQPLPQQQFNDGKHRPPKLQAIIEPPPVFQGPIDIPPEGFTFLGELRKTDPADQETGFPCKVFSVNLVAGKSYTIELRNRGFDVYDAFLRVEDKNFIELTYDDDSGGGRTGQDSRLVFQPLNTDVYRIIASSFDGKKGDFTLKITEN